MPSQHICARLKRHMHMHKVWHSCLSVWDRRYKGAPWDYKSPLFSTAHTYWDMQRQAWSEKHRSLDKREHGSQGALFCFEEGGISHRSAWPECFLYMRCAPLGCLANRKTSVRYKFSLAKGHFLSLKEKQIPLSVLWVLSYMNGLTAKKKHLFLLLLLPAILFDPRWVGGEISLSLETSPSPRSAFQLGVMYSTYSQTQLWCKPRLSTVHTMDNFGSVFFFFVLYLQTTISLSPHCMTYRSPD